MYWSGTLNGFFSIYVSLDKHVADPEFGEEFASLLCITDVIHVFYVVADKVVSSVGPLHHWFILIQMITLKWLFRHNRKELVPPPAGSPVPLQYHYCHRYNHWLLLDGPKQVEASLDLVFGLQYGLLSPIIQLVPVLSQYHYYHWLAGTSAWWAPAGWIQFTCLCVL